MDLKPILLLGDDGKTYPLFAELLREERITRLTLDEAMDGLARLEADLIILDAGFDPDKGILVLGQIKRERPDLPVIYLTNYSSEELVAKVYKLGARDYYKKPVNLADLRSAAQSALQLKRETEERRYGNSTVHGAEHSSSRPTPIVFPGTGTPENIFRAVRYIEKNHERDIYLEALAREACLSKYHFCRLFKRHLGLTPMQFLALTRVERAKPLLRKPDLTIASVGFRVGFNDSGDFTRQFRKLTGMPPFTYRESFRKESLSNPVISLFSEN